MEKSQGGMHRFDRMRRWGLSGARDEFHFDANVQNLKTHRLPGSARVRARPER